MKEAAINIETIYPGMDICEKIERVSKAGFHAVEFWGWQDKDLSKISSTCRKFGVNVQAFSGIGSYSLCDREHSREFIDWIKRSIEAAQKLDCRRLILFPNHFTEKGCADFSGQYSQEAMTANITATLTKMMPILEENKITALLEPLNNWGNDKGMSLTDTAVGADIVRAVDSEWLGLLCDVFHMQLMHGNLIHNIVDNLDVVKYIHLADAPDRHEPGTGEINFDFLIRKLKEHGYNGSICFEYVPKGDTEDGFPALRQLCKMM